METYHASARFILTCNYPNRVIPALHSRCQGFHIDRVDLTEFTARVATVLVNETVEFDLDTLDSYVRATYPDLRKCLNTVQMHSVDGRLSAPSADASGSQDWKLSAVDLFKAGKISEARKLMCASVRPEEMEDMFRWMYDNVELWGKDQESQDQAIIIIRQGLVNVPMVADQEINLSATLCELSRL
jgi:DNA polymerase III delta prime subunit